MPNSNSPPSESSSHEYLTIKEAARYLKVSTSTVRRLIKLGHLKPYRVLRSLRFRREQLDALAAGGMPDDHDGLEQK